MDLRSAQLLTVVPQEWNYVPQTYSMTSLDANQAHQDTLPNAKKQIKSK
jgi:hypothetical protein